MENSAFQDGFRVGCRCHSGWSWTVFEASHTRARSGPPLEGARERGRFGESNQIGRLVHRDLFPAQVVERHLVAQLIQDLLEGRALRFQPAKKRLADRRRRY